MENMLPELAGKSFANSKILIADNFSYIDPVDNSETTAQGLRLLCEDGSRVILRLSGTGTKGATLRIYLERFVSKQGDLSQNPQHALQDLIREIKDLAEIEERTGMSTPTVIT